MAPRDNDSMPSIIGARAFIAGLAVLLSMGSPTSALAQGTVFVQGGPLATSILNDKQDTQSGYLHYNFIGELDWPAVGLLAGGGVTVSRHWSIGGELALRRPQSAPISEESRGHTDRSVISSTYSSRERLLSAIVRYHSSPAGRIDVQPLGGVTFSWMSQALTGRHGVASYPGFPDYVFTVPDKSVDSTKLGLAGGVDVAVGNGGSVSLVVSPRVHWILRDTPTEYEHVVPYAGRGIVSIAAGVRWWPVRR